METRSPVASKRACRYLRTAFFMLRKGLISKRRFFIDMHLMIKRGKFISKRLGNLVFHHCHQRHQRRAGFHAHGCGLQDYEISCNTRANSVFFHTKRATNRNYFCIAAEDDDETPPSILASNVPTICYSPQGDFQLSMSVSECDDEDDGVSGAASPENIEVDDEAEVFIRRFYKQLRRQSRIARLQYELDYQEMLIRGH